MTRAAELGGACLGGAAGGDELGLGGLERLDAGRGAGEALVEGGADLLVDRGLAAPALLELAQGLLGRGEGGGEAGLGLLAGLDEPGLAAGRLGADGLELLACARDIGRGALAQLVERLAGARGFLPSRRQLGGALAAGGALGVQLPRAAMQRLARRLRARGPLGLEHRQPHGVARVRDLAGPEPQPPLARLAAEPRERAERARQGRLAPLGELGQVRRGDVGGRRGRRGGGRRRLGGRAGRLSRLGRRSGVRWRGRCGGEGVALGDRVGEAAFELGGLELQRLDGAEGLGRHAGLGLLGGLGAAGAALGEDRVVDDLAALRLGLRVRSARRRRGGLGGEARGERRAGPSGCRRATRPRARRAGP